MVGLVQLFRSVIGAWPSSAESLLQADDQSMSPTNEAGAEFDGKAEDPLIFAVRHLAPLAF